MYRCVRFATPARRYNGKYHSNRNCLFQHHQQRTLLDAILLKSMGTSFISRVAVEYAYHKYLGIFRYFTALISGERVHHPEISHYAIPLLRRSNNQLITLDDSIIKLKHQYEILQYINTQKCNDDDDNDNNIALILNIGQKKSGKSFNSTLLSILLSDDGGTYFPISNVSDKKTTDGCDISPPLPIIRQLPSTYCLKDIGYIKYLSFIDIEGIDGNIDNIHNNDIVNILKENVLNKYPCIVVLSSMYSFNESDINLVNQLFDNNKETYKNPLILAIAPNIDKIELSSNYLAMKDINNNLKLVELPFIENVNHKSRTSVHNLPINNPFKYMKHKQKSLYFSLCLQVIKTMAESNKNNHCLGISNKDMDDILDNIELATMVNKVQKSKEKLPNDTRIENAI